MPKPDPCEILAQKIISGNYKNVIVLTGAGISTAAGIPDFRSPAIGIYATLKSASRLKFRDPTFVFDIDVFMDDPKPFWWIFSHLWPKDLWPRPTEMHYFIGYLNQLGVLKRVYTQNVDGLEIPGGLPEDKLVQCHGALPTCHCCDCHAAVPLAECLRQIQPNFENRRLNMTNAVVPHCPSCDGEHVKPDVTFFGEAMPDRFEQTLYEDFHSCDLCIITGTSLGVYPFADLVEEVPAGIPRFVINYDKVKAKGGRLRETWHAFKSWLTFRFFDYSGVFVYGKGKDFFIGGDCQEAVKKIIAKANLQTQFEEYKASCANIPYPLRAAADDNQQ